MHTPKRCAPPRTAPRIASSRPRSRSPSIAERGLPDARDHDEGCGGDVLGPVGDRDLRAGALERSAQRAQVAGAVVDERGDHRTPLVLAMPLRAGSGSTASRSASASALNAASATWWES